MKQDVVRYLDGLNFDDFVKIKNEGAYIVVAAVALTSEAIVVHVVLWWKKK